MNDPTVLIIDDQWGRADDPMIPDRYGNLPIRWLLEPAEELNDKHSVRAAVHRVMREAREIATILLDMDFGGDDSRLGLDILHALRDDFPTLPVLMFTNLDSDENRELVIRCMELGANEYMEKAPSAARMLEILSVYTDPASDQAIYGNSPPIRLLRANIARIAFSGETSVLIVGESGTGKELVARALHRQGPRKQGAFVAKNCAQSELHLLDSELFGHEKGAFTGAVARRKGLIEEADGGVLFLDEIADMPAELQGKLLRTLETRSFRRVGGDEEIASGFQLVCATNRKPEDLLKAGRLREDFYYRIATMTLHVPPLRERSDDLPILADWFLRRFKAGGGSSYPGERFAPGFLSRLPLHAWPGNVRELRNAIERAVILSREATIGVGELPEPLAEVGRPVLQLMHACSNPVTDLPENPSHWSQARLLAELRMALLARQHIQAYKGNQWKAEFMRLMYPECKAANAKGFDDLLKRLTQGPWGCPEWQDDPTMSELIEALRR